jgi:hypothetical protein
MNEQHLAEFKESLPEALETEQWAGSKINGWWNWVSKRIETPFPETELPECQLNRDKLKMFCNKDSGKADWECLAAVMAWGGQNRKHGVTVFNRFEEVQPIIHEMRHGAISHIEAYKRFDAIWQKPEKLGMGAAYFTKLIFFCEPTHEGYIMDQWTSKSINLLMDKEIVHLTAGHVIKKNTYENYANFCSCTNSIAEALNIQSDDKGEKVEIAMFSKGGREKWRWRQHVVNEYKNFGKK